MDMHDDNTSAPTVQDQESEAVPSVWFIVLGFFGAVIIPAVLILPIMVVFLLSDYSLQELQDPAVLADGLASLATTPWFIAVGASLTWLSFLLPILVSLRKFSFKKLVTWLPSNPSSYLTAILVGVSLQGAFGLIGFLMNLFGYDSSTASNTGGFSGFSGGWILLAFLIIGVGAPVFEELFFRGFALNILRAKLGWTWAIVITSVLFGSLHVAAASSISGGIILGLFTGTAGLAFALLVRSSGSVKVGIVSHMAFNMVAFFAIFAGVG